MEKWASPEKLRTVWRWSRSYRRAHVPPIRVSWSNTTESMPSRASAPAADRPDAPPPTTITSDVCTDGEAWLLVDDPPECPFTLVEPARPEPSDDRRRLRQ